jgi:hypothetical protein
MENVALSRIKTLKGLIILKLDIKGFHENKFISPDSLFQLGLDIHI